MRTQFFLKRFRVLIIGIPVLITILMLLPLRKAHINPDLTAYLPANIPAKLHIDSLEAIFGKTDPVVIFFETDDVLNPETLNRIGNLTTAFRQMDEFDKVVSLFTMKYIRGEEGNMLVDQVVATIPETIAEREQLRTQIKDNPLVYKLVVSGDFRHTILMVNPVGLTDIETFRLINQKLAAFQGTEKVYLNGMPYMRNEVQQKSARDFMILLPIGLLVMLIFLYFSFREVRGVLLPFSVVVMAVILAMGLMPLLGYELSMIAVLVPILMIAVANNYGVHIVARYQELNARHSHWEMNKITGEAMKHLRRPIVLTALTTMVGILGMAFAVMLPAKQMGYVSAAGIAFALVLSITFLPSVMSGMKKGKVLKSFTSGKLTFIDRLLVWAGQVTLKKPGLVIAVFAGVMIAAGLGISQLQVGINNEEMLPASHPLRISTQIANQYFGGTKTITVLFEGDIYNPEVMQDMERFETSLKANPNVGSVTSLATVTRLISRALNDRGDEFYDKIPDTREAIAQYIEFYNMSGDPSDFEQMVNFDFTRAALTVQFKAVGFREFKTTENQINTLIEASPFARFAAGTCLMEKELALAIVKGQVLSLAFAMAAIILLLWLIFGSLAAGLLGSIPLVFSLVVNFGIMGWAGFDLDVANSLLASIAIGIGIDYTIHLFWRLKTEMGTGKSYPDAIVFTLKTTGRGIAINAFSVIIGFAVLFLSALTLLKAFAFLIILSLLLCLLSALILIPAIVLLLQPKFLTKK